MLEPAPSGHENEGLTAPLDRGRVFREEAFEQADHKWVLLFVQWVDIRSPPPVHSDMSIN